MKICVTFASPVASPINPFGDNGLGVGDASDANLLPSSVRRKKEEEKKRKDARKMGQKMGSDDAQEGSSIPGRKFASLASLASKHTIVDESIVEGCDDDSIRQAGDEPPF